MHISRRLFLVGGIHGLQGNDILLDIHWHPMKLPIVQKLCESLWQQYTYRYFSSESRNGIRSFLIVS